MEDGPEWCDWPGQNREPVGRFVSETRTDDAEGERNAAFIALANPATVITLCDEIDTLKAALTECIKFLDHVEGQGYGGMAIYDVASIMARSALSTQTQGGGENG